MTAGQFIDIPGTARTVLDWVVDHYVASGADLPDLRYIGPGATREIAWDCESVICSCSGVLWGAGPGVGSGVGKRTGQAVATSVRYAVFSIQIVRCVPVPDPNDAPDPVLFTDAGLVVLKDMGLLSQGLVECCGPRGPLKRMGVATAGDVEPLGPAGGFAAVEGHLTVTTANLTSG